MMPHRLIMPRVSIVAASTGVSVRFGRHRRLLRRKVRGQQHDGKVVAQVRLLGADPIQLRVQEIDKDAKLRIVVQCDPLGVHEVAAAALAPGFDSTWVMCKDPHSDKVTPIYSQPQLVCAPW